MPFPGRVTAANVEAGQLVEFVKMRARDGHAAVATARLASRQRFRAVLLTSATTIAGLLPLLFERSLQAQVVIPLVTSLVFGLLASTVLVLLVIPALYAILDDLGLSTASRDSDAMNASVALVRRDRHDFKEPAHDPGGP